MDAASPKAGGGFLADTMQRVTFGKSRWAIDFEDCDYVVDGLKRICHGWNIKVSLPGELGALVRAKISHRNGRWHWRMLGAPKPRDWDRIPPQTPMRVLTDVQDAMLHWHLDYNRRFIGLHAAAVQIGSRLICFPARGYSGKSTLMAALACRGHKVFGDDVIMVGAAGRKALSLGFSPRLRMPYPNDLSARALQFIRANANPADHGWAYVNASAALNEACPIGSIVLLERKSEGRAELGPAPPLECLKVLLAEHLPGRQPLKQVFDCMKRAASEANCYRLAYSRADEAAALLERKLS